MKLSASVSHRPRRVIPAMAAPIAVMVPSGVALKNVNMAVELEGLSYALANGMRAGRGGRRNRAGSLKGTVPRNGAAQSRN